MRIVKKILIVDDSSFMREVLKDLLINNLTDVEVYEADGKKNAINQLQKIIPDIVLLDIVMNENEIEGLEILEEIKKLSIKAKVIMVTSIGQTGIVEQCKRLGVSNYIQKPFNTDEVLEAIEKVMD